MVNGIINESHGRKLKDRFHFNNDVVTVLTLSTCQWIYEEVKAWNAKMRLTMKDWRYHVYQSFYVIPSPPRIEQLKVNRSVVYARKPFPPSCQGGNFSTSASF